MPIHSRIKVISAVCLLILSLGKMACGMVYAAESDEYTLKLAFIYNFAKFVEWPHLDPEAPIVFCIMGDDPFGNSIVNIESKMVGQRKIVVRRNPDRETLKECQILFISASEKQRLEQSLREVKGLSILTISDIPDFIRSGGIIGFRVSNDKIRFQVNLASARSSGLEISSQLLKLAESVRDR
ncbi:MAG: YfiR family protein [Syntrophobacteraceae bacterium]